MESEDDRGAAPPTAPSTPLVADVVTEGAPDCAQSFATPIASVTPAPQPNTTTHAPRRDARAWSTDRNSDRNGTAPAYGALDLGTNNCRLLVARPSRGVRRILAKAKWRHAAFRRR